ncbi:alpha/beta hydrolase (plasmid) [Sinorhizobium meliloti]|nr:alpha/beta hydrolase [Sinorhizobium meliloti]
MGDPDGVPILLLHGFTDSARSWSLTAPYLATGFRVIAPDLRGHGHSDQPEGCYTIPEMANDVRFLIEALDLAPTHVVGHSLGGRLAQAIADRWPHLVRKNRSYIDLRRAARTSGVVVGKHPDAPRSDRSRKRIHPGMVFWRSTDRREFSRPCAP